MYISGNVTVMVRDFEGAVRFYTDVLGMDLRMRGGMDWAEVGVPGLTIGLHHASFDLGPAGGHGSIGLQVDDIDAALTKGDLKFTLDGYKLKGSWALVRTKGGGWGAPDRSWLLIKHRDHWSGALDIADFAPLSVKSKGDFADILSQDDPGIWTSNRPAKTGETGALYQRIIERAFELRGTPPPEPTRPARARKATASGSASQTRQGSRQDRQSRRQHGCRTAGAREGLCARSVARPWRRRRLQGVCLKWMRRLVNRNS